MQLASYRCIWFPHTRLHAGYQKIYCLVDKSGVVFYVGSTGLKLSVRLKNHISEAIRSPYSTNRRKNKVILDNGLNVKIYELERIWLTGFSGRQILEKSIPIEQKWINFFIRIGSPLTNKENHDGSKTELI